MIFRAHCNSLIKQEFIVLLQETRPGVSHGVTKYNQSMLNFTLFFSSNELQDFSFGHGKNHKHWVYIHRMFYRWNVYLWINVYILSLELDTKSNAENFFFYFGQMIYLKLQFFITFSLDTNRSYKKWTNASVVNLRHSIVFMKNFP